MDPMTFRNRPGKWRGDATCRPAPYANSCGAGVQMTYHLPLWATRMERPFGAFASGLAEVRGTLA